jgi:hypothetical protein
MAKHCFGVFILLTAIPLLGCSFRGVDGDTSDQKTDLPDSATTPVDLVPNGTVRQSGEEQDDQDTTPVMIMMDAGITFRTPKPISTVPDGGFSTEGLIEMAEGFFRAQTDVDISALEAPCPTQYPDRCFHSGQAKPEYDQSNNGIYKGVVTGRYSGHILLNIRNDDSESMYADFSYQNDSFDVPLSEFQRSNGTYEYRFAQSDYDFGLIIAENGDIIRDSAMLYVPGGETAVVTIAKEISTQLVEVFEGSFVGSSSGLWNTIVIGNQTTYGYFMDHTLGAGGTTWAEAMTPVTLAGQFQGDDQEAIYGFCFGYRDEDTAWGRWYFQSIDNSINGDWEGAKTL